jgi:hypothetical protein
MAANKRLVEKTFKQAWEWAQKQPLAPASATPFASPEPKAAAPEQQKEPSLDDETVRFAQGNGYFDEHGRLCREFRVGDQPTIRNYYAAIRNVTLTRVDLEIMESNLLTDKEGQPWRTAHVQHELACKRAKELWDRIARARLFDMNSLPKVPTRAEVLKERLRMQEDKKEGPQRWKCDCGVRQCRRGPACQHLLAAATTATSPGHFIREALARGGFHGSSPLAYFNRLAYLDLPATYAFEGPPLFKPREGVRREADEATEITARKPLQRIAMHALLCKCPVNR